MSAVRSCSLAAASRRTPPSIAAMMRARRAARTAASSGAGFMPDLLPCGLRGGTRLAWLPAAPSRPLRRVGGKAHGMARRGRHRPRRMGDGRMTAAPIPCGAARGFTLIELLVTLALAAVLMGIALPHASRDQFNLWTAQTQLLGDLRTVRTNAITKGVHYQVVLTASGYTMNRMKQNSGNGAWVVDYSVSTRTFPRNVTL